MSAQSFDDILENVYQWVGSRLVSCPVRDGVSFYNGSEKILKVLRSRNGWHLQFNVPVPECEGLTILSPEEARSKKLGKTRWIYLGSSEEDAKLIVQFAVAHLPLRRVVEPAMSREDVILCGATCSCFKKMERIVSNKLLPKEITDQLERAYDLLQDGDYIEFVRKTEQIIDEVAGYLINDQGVNPDEMRLSQKIEWLAERRIISKTLREEVDAIFARRTNDVGFGTQERAYPMALMRISFMSKLIKVCV